MGRVIVGFDGKPGSTSALRWAALEAGLRNTEVVVLTAIDDNTPDEQVMGITDQVGQRIAQVLGPQPVEHLVVRGHAAGAIVGATDGDDLVVVGSRRRGPLAERLLGSVSHACLHAAAGSVAIVPDDALPDAGRGDGPVVVVGVDGSDVARAALLVARDEAHLRRARLQVANAVYWENIGEEWITPTLDDLLAWGRNLIEKELRETGVSGDALVEHGRADEVLVDQSRAADLLVLGVRGRSPLVELLVGSTADACARSAACPVLFVRDPG